ncbi:hypothetical protein BJV82DRAFT_583024 [Fennellomyces sp. T-0311]|nr:hypothetical protein BJV82DRAFT_583024 [Fennellomyces sp. T-0311]
MSYTSIQLQFQLPMEHEQPSIPPSPPSFQTQPVDFLYCLPCELVPGILQHFPIKELFDCMAVSQTWRDRIQSSPSLWHEISIMKDDDTLIPQLAAVENLVG